MSEIILNPEAVQWFKSYGLWIIILIAYFIPSIISTFRNTKSGLGIFMLNLFLGWTLIGYIAAFIWAFTAKTIKEYKSVYDVYRD